MNLYFDITQRAFSIQWGDSIPELNKYYVKKYFELRDLGVPHKDAIRKLYSKRKLYTGIRSGALLIPLAVSGHFGKKAYDVGRKSSDFKYYVAASTVAGGYTAKQAIRTATVHKDVGETIKYLDSNGEQLYRNHKLKK